MPTPPSLVDELKSLRIERELPNRSLPGWATALIVALVLLLAGTLAWKLLANRIFEPEVETSAVALVSQSQGSQLLVATGYVVPQRKANISPRIGGRVAKLFVEDGSVVKAGQLIAILEDADYKAQLMQATADARGAEAREKNAEVTLTDAQRGYDREQIVQQKGVSTPQAADTAVARLGQAKAQVAAARADVSAAQARIAVARVALDNCYVKAPFGGRITQKLTDIGEIVFGAVGAGGGGPGGIASLADFTTLQVEADVSESQVAKLKMGTPAEIVLDAFPEKHFRARVAEVRPRVDRAKATVTVKVAFVDDTTDVLPDMGAKVTFLSKELDESASKAAPTPALNPDALIESGETKTVLVVAQDGTLSSVPVVTGPPLGSLVSLRAGPPPGSHVVRKPAPELRAGMKVKEKQ